MTERSSCKSFFKKYLIYRIKSQKMNFILCCILNVLALPLYAISSNMANNLITEIVPDFANCGYYFSIVCIFSLPVLAIIGTVFSFEYYNTKNLTDMVGALPLSYKERFWGDFLGGYIVNVMPVIPCGIFSIIVFANTQSKFNDFCANNGITSHHFNMASLGAGIALTLFIITTFAYLFTVLVVSGCGKVFHSVIFSIFGMVAITVMARGIAGCFANSAIINSEDYITALESFFPPVGLLGNLFGSLNIFGAIDLINLPRIEDNFIVFKPLYPICFVILGAGITAGAFFLGKRRNPEKTGSSFVIKPVFYVISSLLSAAAAMIMPVITNNADEKPVMKLLLAVIAGGVMCLVSNVIYLPKLKELPKSVLCCCAAVAVSLGIAMLFKKTGSFGLRYLPEDAENIEYLKINDITVTDKEDIKQYIKKHNAILKNSADILSYGYAYSLEYRTSDGKTTKRGYSQTSLYPVKDMLNNVKTLNGYGKYFFAQMNEGEWDYLIVGENEKYDIPEEREEEFFGILREEAETKYDPDAEVYARVEFSGSGSPGPFYIQKDFEKTIAFLDSINGVIEKNPDEIMISIDYNVYDTNIEDRSLSIYIRNKDMNSGLVRELIGLMKKTGEGDGDEDNYFSIDSYDITGSKYYVPRKNTKRVLKIMTELALGDFE